MRRFPPLPCAVAATLVAISAGGSTLSRLDAPVVIQALQPSDDPVDAGYATGSINVALPAVLLGIDPGDLVAFRWDGLAWEQIPVQVDERKTIDLNDVYTTRPSCSDPCYDNTLASAIHSEYADPATFVGADPDATLDSDDEIAFMAFDAGAQVGTPYAPPGVDPASAVEVQITDPLDSGVGYVYLFESTSGLDPAAGKDYVSYDFELINGPYGIAAYNPSDPDPGEGMNFGPRPETSSVTTDNYERGFTDRWYDNELRIFRGDATGVDILDRHDDHFDDRDLSCYRTQATFRAGEGAFIANIDGPVRAIRDFVGANSGPHVQRQHVFYASLEIINTFLRVHPIPGVVDFFDYSSDGIGLIYENGFLAPGDTIVAGTPSGGVVIDGNDDAVAGLGATGVDFFETVDGPQGALSMPQRLLTNNPDTSYRVSYRDGNPVGGPAPCTGDDTELYGASGVYLNTGVLNTDEGNATLYGPSVNLNLLQQIYYEAPGDADGPKRVRELASPLDLTLTPVSLPEPGANALPGGLALLAALGRRRRRAGTSGGPS